MTKKLFSLIAVAALVLGFASCTDNKEEQTMSITDDVLVTNSQVTTAGKIHLKMNITNSTIDITMPVQKGGSTVDATIKDLKLSFSNTLGYTFSATNADAVDGSGKSIGVKINSLNGFLQMFNNPEIEQNIAITYNVDFRDTQENFARHIVHSHRFRPRHIRVQRCHLHHDPQPRKRHSQHRD